ncbi:eukaryotic translation initiation factor 3 subunit E [Haplosporangium gracile]|nr:eukaryotic translation initiation factor 3 subunit E [Haplosporangium gracile]
MLRNRITFPLGSITHSRQLALKISVVDFIDKLHGEELADAGVIPAGSAPFIPNLSRYFRQRSGGRLQKSNAEAQKVMEVIEDRDVTGALRQDKFQNLQFLKDNYDMTPKMIQTLYTLSQFQHSYGNYGSAVDMFYHYRVLSTDDTFGLSALWDKLASEILVGNWQVAFEAGRDAVIESLFQLAYTNTIQTSCPWILRYLAVAVMTNKGRKNLLKELVRVIERETYRYNDPITELVETLYNKFDFDLAKKKLAECEDVLENDFFLVSVQDEFIVSARFLISGTSCRIHQKIDTAELSQRLKMNKKYGEKWIVNLTRDARVDAKIDFQDNAVLTNNNI